MSLLPTQSQRALYAIRLVLRDFHLPPPYPKRGFSTAILPHFPSSTSSRSTSTSTTSTSFWDPRHASSDIPTGEFLEPPSEEYETVGLSLPIRPSYPTAHWAQLYPSPSTPVRRCDHLHHLAISGDLNAAMTVHEELSSLHIGIIHRQSYLPVAISSLSPVLASQKDFLFWLELIPNRPAVKPHPTIKSIWNPIIDKILNTFPVDKGFIGDFLAVMARKGTLPLVLGRIMRHLAVITHPEELRMMMDDLMRVYVEGTTSRGDNTSQRAEVHLWFAGVRVGEMWNSFVRALVSAGWVREAEMIIGEEREWSDDTLECVRLAIERKEGKVEGVPKMRYRQGISPIIRQVFEARGGRISPKPLAELVDTLQSAGRGRLVSLLEKRLTKSPTNEIWPHAQILLARQQGASPMEVVEVFNKYFLWVGIPPISLSLPTSTSSGKMIPSSFIITTLLPSLLSLLPSPGTFYAEYLNLLPTFSPRLQPTPGTHFVFLRQLTHLQGPSAGLIGLRDMISSGFIPGVGAYNAVLWSMAGRGDWNAVTGLLVGMEEGREIVTGLNMPEPEEGTYKGLRGILEGVEMFDQAEEVRIRAEERFGVQGKIYVRERKVEEGSKKGRRARGKEGGRVVFYNNKEEEKVASFA